MEKTANRATLPIVLMVALFSQAPTWADEGELHDFSGIPQDILESILKRVDPESLIKARAVNKTWKNAAEAATAFEKAEIKTIMNKKLFDAITKNNTCLAIKLIHCGTNVDKIDSHKRTALMAAARMNNLEVVQALIAAGAQIDTQDRYGETALIGAARRGNLEIVQALVDAGAGVNQMDSVDKTALAHAAQRGHTQVVRDLIEKGAGVDGYDPHELPPHIPSTTPLMRAAIEGHTAVVTELIAAGANINKTDSYGRTALHRAVIYNHPEVVEVLAKQYPVDALNTALMHAAENGHLEVVRELIKKGAKRGCVVM